MTKLVIKSDLYKKNVQRDLLFSNKSDRCFVCSRSYFLLPSLTIHNQQTASHQTIHQNTASTVCHWTKTKPDHLLNPNRRSDAEKFKRFLPLLQDKMGKIYMCAQSDRLWPSPALQPPTISSAVLTDTFYGKWPVLLGACARQQC